MNHDKNVTTTVGHLIDGKLVADTERTQPVFNPATGQSTTSVALASQATVEAAIASAEAAFPAWRNTPPLKRARVMSKLKVLLEENADKIAALITAEHGKVLADAHGELQRGIENVEYASYAPELLKGEHSRNVGPGIDIVERVPGAGRHGRHHALQLPGHGAAVDVAHGRGLWQHLRAQALRARPVSPPCSSPSWRWKPACRPACSTWSTATSWPWTRCCKTRA